MTDPYLYWKSALAGEKPKCFNEQPELGFYRRGIYTKVPNKAAKRTGWTPVAIFMNGSKLTAVVGTDAFADQDRLNTLWSHCAGNPISEEWYRAVTRGEPWPDSHETVTSIPVANSSSTADEPIIVHGLERRQDSDTNPHILISAHIDDCITQIIKYSKIESDEQSAKARSLQNRFLELRGQAAQHYETANRPLLEQQKKLRETWFPLRDLADAGSTALRTAMGTWEDTKRQAARLAQEATDKAAQEHAEAARKAAEANQPAPPPPEPAKSNVPAPAAQIKGGTGRAASVSVAVFVTAIDEEAVFKQFKGNLALTELLTALAQKAIRAGIPVPGATTEERSVVR